LQACTEALLLVCEVHNGLFQLRHFRLHSGLHRGVETAGLYVQFDLLQLVAFGVHTRLQRFELALGLNGARALLFDLLL